MLDGGYEWGLARNSMIRFREETSLSAEPRSWVIVIFCVVLPQLIQSFAKGLTRISADFDN